MVLINPNYRAGVPGRMHQHHHDHPGECDCLPAANIVRFDNHAEVHLFVPGRTKKDFDINLDKDILTVSGKEKETSEGEYLQKEFSTKEFKRNFQVSDAVDTDKIEASYENGVLSLKLPFREDKKPKKKDIQIS